MARLEGVKAGDELLRVLRIHGGTEPTAVTVAKVGRRLVHIPRYEDQPDGPTDTFEIVTGLSKDGAYELMTREAWEDGKKREDLWERLREHGFTGTMRATPVETKVLEAVVAVLDEHAKGAVHTVYSDQEDNEFLGEADPSDPDDWSNR
jgi:hypothetical protein